jgi:hypothetical protein
VDTTWRNILWQQFGAAIDMLEIAILACPDEVWSGRDAPAPTGRPEFWYVAYHALFFLDLYLSDSVEGFAPPPPFTLSELDPAEVPPERTYTKAELQAYLEHGRRKCRATIKALTDHKVRRRCGFDWLDLSDGELLLYNMRHVQHHAAQLNLILRQTTDSAPAWVGKAKS